MTAQQEKKKNLPEEWTQNAPNRGTREQDAQAYGALTPLPLRHCKPNQMMYVMLYVRSYYSKSLLKIAISVIRYPSRNTVSDSGKYKICHIGQPHDSLRIEFLPAK